ncbi:hypothetical protein I4F81_012384 [Pyropia yezoensis]|uniref:Uncharacterized protein n=1 Tax=Pyropia yezoensis TaxID=2788 RepID=A0ACC3CJ17_PYRYE|nr:hypothetical protein I4F81_012384 [Neopyropia yezoensis]
MSVDDLRAVADGGAAGSSSAAVEGGLAPRPGRRSLWRLPRSGWRRLEPTHTALRAGLRRLGDTDLPPGVAYTPTVELRATFSVTPSRLAVLDAREALPELGLRDRAVHDAFRLRVLLLPPATSPLSRPPVVTASCWVRPSETLSAVRAKVLIVTRHWPRCRGFWAGFPGGGGGGGGDTTLGGAALPGWDAFDGATAGGAGGGAATAAGVGAVVTEMGRGGDGWVAVSDEATVAEVGLTAQHGCRLRP